MGAQLVRRAFTYAVNHDLKPNEFRLLAFMALTALDTDEKPRYFAAREASALALGRLVPDELDPSDDGAAPIRAEREAAFQRVKTAIAGLMKAGAIQRVRRGRVGTRAEFALVFGSVENVSDADSRGTESVPLESTENVPLLGTENVLRGVRKTYPQGTTEEPLQDQQPRQPRHPAPSHFQPVDKNEGVRNVA